MTTNQHYVPQFIVKNFAIDKEKKKVKVFNKKYNKFERKSISHFPSEKNFYEVYNKDGSFYDKDEIEKSLGRLESEISIRVSKLLSFYSVFSTDANMDIDICAALHMLLTLQTLRTKDLWDGISKLCENDKDTFNAIKETFFINAKSGENYMKHNKIHCSNDTKKALKGIVTLDDFLLRNATKFLPYCVVAPMGYSFMCSDSPVINTSFKGVHAVFPISPKVAICFCPKEHADREGYYGRICPCSSKLVETINKAIFEKGRIIIYNEENRSQLSELIKKTEN